MKTAYFSGRSSVGSTPLSLPMKLVHGFCGSKLVRKDMYSCRFLGKRRMFIAAAFIHGRFTLSFALLLGDPSVLSLSIPLKVWEPSAPSQGST